MHGNRDFLVGEHYLSRCGMQALPDPWHGLLFGEPTALSHGDMLCTDDSAYQQFRHMSRNPQWQSAFLSKPLAERVAYAQHLRAESMKNKAAAGVAAPHAASIPNSATNMSAQSEKTGNPGELAKSSASGQTDIMDVNAQAVRNALEGHWPNGVKTPLAARLIHGHTHRPAVHHIKLENGNEAQRWVLPDWDFDHAQSVRGHLLRVDENGVAVQVLSSH